MILMLEIIKRMENLLNKIVSLQQFISNIFLIFIMFIITFDVIGRNLLNKPLKGTYEMTELGAAMLVFFALAVTHQHKEHISIDFAVEKLPARVKSILNGFIELIIFVLLMLMANQVLNNATRTMARKTTTTDLGLLIYPFLYIAAFGIVIFALAALASAIKYWAMAVNKT